MTIFVSEPVAKWLLHAAERKPADAFNTFAPHACKLCDTPTSAVEQRKHLAAHRTELRDLEAKRRRDALKAMRRANRLKREANHAA